MGTIHVIQCLCPVRHCYAAVAYEEPTSYEEAVGPLVALVARSPHCGICGSRELTYEDRETGYPDMATAAADLREGQTEQLATRELMDRLGLTHDSKKRRPQ